MLSKNEQDGAADTQGGLPRKFRRMLLLLAQIFLLLFPLLLLTGAFGLFCKEWIEMSWPEVPVVIVGSEAQSRYDSSQEYWCIDVNLGYTASYEGKSIAGNIFHSNSFAREPDTADIESHRMKILRKYQRDGLTIHVNPDDIRQTAFDTSLATPISLFIFGIAVIIYMLKNNLLAKYG